MKIKILQYLLVVAISTVLIACESEQNTLRIGSKNFAENMVLAEMMAQLAENEGIVVERNIPYGKNTQDIMEATKQNVLDVYPEYNGTGLVFLGQAPTSDGDASTAKVQELFKPLGLEWKGRFGFSNDYAIVMNKERADELGVTSISDLSNTSSAVNFAIDGSFSKRGADGFKPLIRHYGISPGSVSEFTEDSEGKDNIVQALLEGSADVAELFVTDGQIAEYDLVLLKDDKRFFPVYEPAPLVRSDALAKFPKLEGVLGKLKGVITTEDMQAMNKSVDLDAQTPASVATSFLVAKGLLPEGSAGASVEKLIVAADPSIGRSSQTARALRAIRAGFSGKDLEILNSQDPLQTMAEGTARLAMVGAESFYSQGNAGPMVKDNARAFSVLGYKTAHLITRNGSGVSSISNMTKIVTAAKGSGSSIILNMILNSLALDNKVTVVNTEGDYRKQFNAVTNSEVDAAFTLAEQGDRKLKSALKNIGLQLIGIDEWSEGGHTAQYSFIRPSTIPAGTYPNQSGALASVSTQFVLASPVEKQQEAGEVGPGTAGVASVAPVSADAVKSINEALDNGEIVDPAIPIHSALVPKIEVVDKSLPFSFDTSVLNIVMILFTAWIIFLCFLPSPRDFTLPKIDE